MIRYKIIQMDSGMEKYLPFAKREVVKQLATMTSINKDFNRTWIVDGVTIRARSIGFASASSIVSENSNFNEDDQLVKLWISGTPLYSYFYSQQVHSPDDGLELFFQVVTPLVLLTPAIVSGGLIGGVYSPTVVWEYRDLSGKSWGGGSGTVTGTVGNHVFTNYYDGSNILDGADPVSSTVAYKYSAAYANAYSAAFSASANERKGYVSLSNGVILASWSLAFDSNYVCTNAPRFMYQTVNFPQSVSVTGFSVWGGDNYVELNDGTRITFVAPANTHIYEQPGNPNYDGFPTTPVAFYGGSSEARYFESYLLGGSISTKRTETTVRFSDGTQQIYIGSMVYDSAAHTTTVTNFATWGFSDFPYLINGVAANDITNTPIDGRAPPAGLTSVRILDRPPSGRAVSDWAAARIIARARERDRLKAVSDVYIAALDGGSFASLVQVSRIAKPYSSFTYMPTVMSATISDSATGSSDDTTTRRVVVLSYSYIDDKKQTQKVAKTINGTKRITITRLADSKGAPNQAQYTTTTYSQWLNFTAQTGESRYGDVVAYVDFFSDYSPFSAMVEQIDGVTVSGAKPNVRDLYGKFFIPPPPNPPAPLVFSHPDIYRDYRARIKLVYDADLALPAKDWTDSSFIDQELIDVYFIYMHNTDYGPLGIFPQFVDIPISVVGGVIVLNENKVSWRCSHKVTFQYSYFDGSFKLVNKWRVIGTNGTQNSDGSDAFISIPAAFALSSVGGFGQGAADHLNIVFANIGPTWKDVNKVRADQSNRFAARVPDPPLNTQEAGLKLLADSALKFKIVP